MSDAKIFCKNRAVHFKKHTPQKMLSSFYTILQFFISTIIHEFSTKRSFLKQEIYIQADCTNLHVFHCVLLGIYEFPAHKSIPTRKQKPSGTCRTGKFCRFHWVPFGEGTQKAVPPHLWAALLFEKKLSLLFRPIPLR